MSSSSGSRKMPGSEGHPRPPRAKHTAHSYVRRPRLENLDEDSSLSSNCFSKSKSRAVPRETSRRSKPQCPRHPVEASRSSSSSISGPCYRQTHRCGGTMRKKSYLDREDSDSEEQRWSYVPTTDSSELSYAGTSSSCCTDYSSYISFASRLSSPSDVSSYQTPRRPQVLAESSVRRVSPTRRMEMLRESYDALKRENGELRRKLVAVQTFSDMQTEMVRQLESKMQRRVAKENLECGDLELVRQDAQEKLTVMLKRTLIAERKVLKLKEHLRALEIEMIYFQREKELLQHRNTPEVLKNNAGTVLQNIDLVRDSIKGSLKHLVYGADALKLVVEILKSVDQIADSQEEEGQ